MIHVHKELITCVFQCSSRLVEGYGEIDNMVTIHVLNIKSNI